MFLSHRQSTCFGCVYVRHFVFSPPSFPSLPSSLNIVSSCCAYLAVFSRLCGTEMGFEPKCLLFSGRFGLVMRREKETGYENSSSQESEHRLWLDGCFPRARRRQNSSICLEIALAFCWMLPSINPKKKHGEGEPMQGCATPRTIRCVALVPSKTPPANRGSFLDLAAFRNPSASSWL